MYLVYAAVSVPGPPFSSALSLPHSNVSNHLYYMLHKILHCCHKSHKAFEVFEIRFPLILNKNENVAYSCSCKSPSYFFTDDVLYADFKTMSFERRDIHSQNIRDIIVQNTLFQMTTVFTKSVLPF